MSRVTLPGRPWGRIGLATVAVIGVDKDDCLAYMRANKLEFCYPVSVYAIDKVTVTTPRMKAIEECVLI